MNKTNNTVETTNKNKSEVVSYEVIAMNGKQKELTFYNAKLIEHTKRIQKLRDAGNLAILAIANVFDAMDKDESYKTAGFKTVAEYGRIVFDYKPSTVSLYLRSARAFLTNNEKGEVIFRENLPKLTVGQMIELLPLVTDETNIDKVITAFQDGNINQRMSTKDMRDAVNSIRGIEVKSKTITEKSEIAKADKLGEYNKDKLPKNVTPLGYATTQLEASIETFENYVKALPDIEQHATVEEKAKKVMKMMLELRAELTK
jgi:adenine-specific DNA glycosylase